MSGAECQQGVQANALQLVDKLTALVENIEALQQKAQELPNILTTSDAITQARSIGARRLCALQCFNLNNDMRTNILYDTTLRHNPASFLNAQLFAYFERHIDDIRRKHTSNYARAPIFHPHSDHFVTVALERVACARLCMRSFVM